VVAFCLDVAGLGSSALATIEISGTPAPPASKPALPASKPAPPASTPVPSASAPAPPASKTAPPVSPSKGQAAPSLSVGDTWEFARVDDLDLRRVGRTFRTTIASADATGYTSRGGSRFNRSLGIQNEFEDGREAVRHDPAAYSLRFPLAVGKTWTDGWTTDRPNGSRIARVSANVTVTGYETVTVAAGTFKAFKVVFTLRGERPDGHIDSTTHTRWYAPEAKFAVRIRHEGRRDDGSAAWSLTSELKSYAVAP
jgi:hypothetical protein